MLIENQGPSNAIVRIMNHAILIILHVPTRDGCHKQNGANGAKTE